MNINFLPDESRSGFDTIIIDNSRTTHATPYSDVII